MFVALSAAVAFEVDPVYSLNSSGRAQRRRAAFRVRSIAHGSCSLDGDAVQGADDGSTSPGQGGCAGCMAGGEPHRRLALVTCASALPTGRDPRPIEAQTPEPATPQPVSL